MKLAQEIIHLLWRGNNVTLAVIARHEAILLKEIASTDKNQFRNDEKLKYNYEKDFKPTNAIHLTAHHGKCIQPNERCCGVRRSIKQIERMGFSIKLK